jgi:cation:H+ antiporter
LVVQHAPVIGLSLGMNPLLTGLLIVAIGTALPEAVTAVIAARRSQGDIVAGHVIGSSLFNLLVVVGGMAALRDLPIPASFVRFELPAALAFSLLLYPMLRRDLHISRNEGIVLLLALIGWIVYEVMLMR